MGLLGILRENFEAVELNEILDGQFEVGKKVTLGFDGNSDGFKVNPSSVTSSTMLFL
jgi:hypothetical protein